jgi:putative protease
VVDTGVKVLKIEGRGRAADYVATVIKTYREAIDSYYDNTYNEDKVANWMEELNKVYNRGFWSGYYLGQKLGEWTDTPGSKASQKKIYLGKGIHYFPKSKVAHFKIETQTIKVGDQILITGPTTGVIESSISSLRVDDKQVDQAGKGEEITFPLNETIRSSDKIYKLVEA